MAKGIQKPTKEIIDEISDEKLAGMVDNTGNIYENKDFFVKMSGVYVELSMNHFEVSNSRSIEKNHPG